MTDAKPRVHSRGSVHGGDDIAVEMVTIMTITMHLSSRAANP